MIGPVGELVGNVGGHEVGEMVGSVVAGVGNVIDEVVGGVDGAMASVAVVSQTSGPPSGPQPGGPGRARTGRSLVVLVAGLEAAVAVVGAVTAALSGVQGGSLVLAGGVAGVAGGVAYLLVEVARAFARGRRWPRGVFVTAQLLVALVALSLGGRALLTFAENPPIGVVTVVALALAAAGLAGVALLGGEPPGAGASSGSGPDEAPPPVS